MSITYGSTVNFTRPLTQDDFANLPKHQQSGFSWTTFIRIFLVIAEIGLSILAPGAGTAVGAAAQVGIGLAFASANLGVSAANGDISGIGTGIDFASALIPLGGTLKLARGIGKVTESKTAEELADIVGRSSIEEAKKALPSAKRVKAAQRVQRAADKRDMYDARLAVAAATGSGSKKAAKFADGFIRRLLTNSLRKEEKAMLSMLQDQGLTRDAAAMEVLDKLSDYRRFGGEKELLSVNELSERMGKASTAFLKAKESLEKHLLIHETSIQQMEQYMKELKEVFEEVKTWSIGKRLFKSDWIKKVGKMPLGDQGKLFEDIFSIDRLEGFIDSELAKRSVFGRAKNAFTASRLRKEKRIQMAMQQLHGDDKDIFIAIYNRTLYHANIESSTGQMATIFKKANPIDQSMEEWLSEANKLFDKLTPAGQQVVLGTFSTDSFEQVFKTFSSAGEPSKLSRVLKYLGSSQFNSKWVQKLQLIDSNDFGRAIPEGTYQVIKNKFLNSRLKKEWEKFEKAFEGKYANVAKKAMEIDTDAVIRVEGRYINMIRPLSHTKGMHLCLVTFNPINTAAKDPTAKNFGGKAPVIIQASTKDLEGLTLRGEEYWWAYGQRRGWYTSRGGRRIGSNLKAVSTALHLFLGFAPIPVLRNVLSIVSNWTENIADMARGHYAENWLPKFERAIIRTSINRTLRFTSRYLLGEAYIRHVSHELSGKAQNKLSEETAKLVQQKLTSQAAELSAKQFDALYSKTFKLALNKATSQALRTKAQSAKWVGRELQRITSATASLFEGKTANGYFTFKTPTAQQAGSKILTTMVTGVKGYSLRKSNDIFKKRAKAGQPGITNSARQLIGAKRNLGQITRIYSAVTPSKTVKPLRSLTRFG